MGKLLDRWAPARLRLLGRRCIEAPARLSLRRELGRRRLTPPAGRPVLSFGGIPLAGADGVIHGGRVKLLHLRDAFETDERSFNILYLVSSALPPHAGEVAAWAKQNGARVVLNQNGVAYPAWAGTGYLSYNQAAKEVHRQADFVFYQSEFCKAGAAEFLGPGRSGSVIAYNPVDTARFEPAPPRERPPWRLLATGTHEQGGRVLLALSTLAALLHRGKPCALTIAGRLTWPDAAREVRARVEQLNLATRVELRGAFSQADAPEIYRGADILLHLKYADPCPTVPIEALACGLPVIGSATGGMPELISPETGILIEVEKSNLRESYPEPEQIADAVEAIMNRYDSFRHAARESALERFGKENWIAEHRRIFDELASGHA